MDKSAVVIVLFYNISFFLKMVGVILYKVTKDNNKWIILITYIAIMMVWVMLYYFVFEMRSVQIKIESDDPQITERRLKKHWVAKIATISILVAVITLSIALLGADILGSQFFKDNEDLF